MLKFHGFVLHVVRCVIAPIPMGSADKLLFVSGGFARSAETGNERSSEQRPRSGRVGIDLGDACLIGPRGVPGKKIAEDPDAGSTKKASRQRHVVGYCTVMDEHYSLCGSARNSALCRAVSRVSLSPVVRPGAEWPPEEISRGFAIQRWKATGIGTTKS
jgi:hypothetical protein